MEIMLMQLTQHQDGSIALRLRLTGDAAATGGARHRETRTLCLTSADWQSMGLEATARQLLTTEQYELLLEADRRRAALNKGAELLSYGACSRRALEQKLRQRGYDAELAGQVAGELSQRGMIREQDDARAVVRVCLRSGYGRGRILAKLRQKGYGDEAIRAALDEVDEDSYIEGCMRMMSKKYGTIPAGAAEQQRMIAALARLGYSLSQIRQAAAALREQEDGE